MYDDSASEPHPSARGRTSGLARYLAPASLVLVVAVVVIIVTSAHGSSAGSHAATRLPAVGTHPTRAATPRTGTATPRTGTSTTGTGTSTTGTGTSGTYTVAAGDTFGAISAETGVPISTIEELNPGVSSSALTVGQVLKLK